MPQIDGKQVKNVSIVGGKLVNATVDTLQLAADAADATIVDLADTYDFSPSGTVRVATPAADTDAANKAYVDAVAAGLDPKHSVKATTDAALPANTPSGAGVGKIITANANGLLSIDGISTWVDIDNDGGVNDPFSTATKADRVLVKNEGGGTSIHNGVYAVKDKGSGVTPFILVRADDADQDVEVTAGLFTFTSEGTQNGDQGFTLVTNDPIIVDTTALTFTQSSGAGQIIAGAGLVKSGNTIDVGDVNKGVQANADDLQIDASEIAGDGLQQVAGGGNEHLLEMDLAAGGGLKIVTGELAVEPNDFVGNGLEDDGADNLQVKPDATETAPSIVVDASGVRAAVPTKSDKARAAQATVSDFDAVFASGGITSTPAGDGYVKVEVNGVPIEVGDGLKTKECYFSGNGGVAARAIADIIATDTLHWVGSVVNYEIAATDIIDLHYNVAA